MREIKDSGIEWIGEIPKDWKLQRGKYLFSQRNEKGNNINLQLLSPTQRFGVIPQEMYEELSGMTAVKLNEKTDLNLMKTIHKGDFCISLRSFQGGFEYSNYEGVVSQAYQVFYPIVDISERYYKYLFKDCGFIDKMNSYTMTLRDGKNISFSDFGNTYIPYPPLSTQHSIADFLVRKCSEIDSLTADIEEQIETLEQYKKSVITEAVTKGLDPGAEMKDSGVEWIGEIPKEWEIGKVAFLYDVTLGKMIQPVQLHDSDTLEYYLCAVNLGQNRLKLDNLKQMWISPQEKKNLQLNKGDLVVVEGGDVASCDIIPYDLNNIYFQNSIMRVCGRNGNDNRIMKYVLMVAKSSGHIDLMCNKATIAHFTKEKLMSLQIPMIPVSEQKVIADYLDDKCAEIDSIIADKQSQLDALSEYEKSLIYEYVTGKKEVPAS